MSQDSQSSPMVCKMQSLNAFFFKLEEKYFYLLKFISYLSKIWAPLAQNGNISESLIYIELSSLRLPFKNFACLVSANHQNSKMEVILLSLFYKGDNWGLNWTKVGHSFFPKEQVSFNFVASVTICSDFGPQENSLSLFPLFPHLFVIKWWDRMPWS